MFEETDYQKGWKAAQRLFMKKGEVDKERDNPFEAESDEWYGFVGCCEYNWKVAVE